MAPLGIRNQHSGSTAQRQVYLWQAPWLHHSNLVLTRTDKVRWSPLKHLVPHCMHFHLRITPSNSHWRLGIIQVRTFKVNLSSSLHTRSHYKTTSPMSTVYLTSSHDGMASSKSLSLLRFHADILMILPTGIGPDTLTMSTSIKSFFISQFQLSIDQCPKSAGGQDLPVPQSSHC